MTSRPAREIAPAAGGFTLVELLVALVVAVIIMIAAVTAFQLGNQTVLGAMRQTEAQENARWVLERMVTEIRGAGYDPTAIPPTYNFDAVTGQSATGLILQNDFNGNGALDAAVSCTASAPAERVGYRLVGTELRRSTDPPGNACEDVVVGGVTSLGFSYLDADGNVTAAPTAIRTVVVSVTASSQTGNPARSVVVADRVRVRNR